MGALLLAIAAARIASTTAVLAAASATLGQEIESVDQDLSQVGGVDPWNSAAVIS